MKIHAALTAACVIWVSTAWGQPTARPRIEQTVFELADGRKMTYAIAVPRDLDPTQSRPLVLALHPGGRAPYYGSRFMWQIVEPALREWRAIIVAPDVLGRRWDNDDSENAVLALLESVLTTHNIDRTRILVTGFSMGGMGTWYFATRPETLFTGAIPMAASRRDNPLDHLGTMPIHVIHSPQDEVIPFGPAADTVEQLRGQGHPVELIAVDGAGHSNMGAYVEPLTRAGEWMMERWSHR